MMRGVTVNFKDGRIDRYNKAGGKWSEKYYYVALYQFELDDIESIVVRHIKPRQKAYYEVVYKSGVEISDELRDYLLKNKIIRYGCKIKTGK